MKRRIYLATAVTLIAIVDATGIQSSTGSRRGFAASNRISRVYTGVAGRTGQRVIYSGYQSLNLWRDVLLGPTHCIDC